MATMNSGLGPPAGYGSNVYSTANKALGGVDDGSVEIDVTSVFGADGINFFGIDYTEIYLNSNGTISFGTPFTDFQTSDLTAETTPMLAPFFADVNVSDGGEIYWDVSPGANPDTGTITMTWLNVAPYSGSGTNSFQVVLTSNGGGDFSVEYIYEDIQWAGSGSDVADVGYTDGGANDVLLDGSGNSAELLNYDSNDFQNGDPNGTFQLSFVDGVPATPDGIVEGSSGNDTIDSGYTGDPDGDVVDGSANQIFAYQGDDNIEAGGGADTVYGGTGDDTIDGGGGTDVIYGDNGGATDPADEFLDWSAQGADESSLAAGFTQTTGLMDVTVSFDNGGSADPAFTVESTDTTYTEPGEPFDATSSAHLFSDNAAASSVRLAFSAVDDTSGIGSEVSDVQFRINDIDWASGNHTDVITVNAFDAANNPVTVTIQPETGDEVDVNTITAEEIGESQSDAGGSALITIAGPVESIQIIYTNAQSGTQAVWISDVHFTTIAPEDGDDDIDGGGGRDFIDGEGGNDTIDGGTGGGNDTILGGDGDDLITDSGNDNSDDSIDGGAGNDNLDGGAGQDELVGGTGDDTLAGGTGADKLGGGTGDDLIYVAQGDTAAGEDGDDLFVLTDLGEAGNDAITIIGGEGDETDGDTLQLTSDVSFADINFDPIADNAGGLSGNFTMSDGTVVTFSEIENIICFTPGAMILTPRGPRPVESLQIGDFVITRDNGPQPIRWLGSRTVEGRGRFAPIEIDPIMMDGADRALCVSPQHRILYSGYQAELLFGTPEVLIAAKHLVDGTLVRQIDTPRVTYIHMMLDAHEIIYANGAATESFHAGEAGLSAITDASREEMFALFPDLRSDPNAYGRSARVCLKKHEAQLLSAYTRLPASTAGMMRAA